MVLYELTQLYQHLVQQGKLSADGWVDEKVSFAVVLNGNGEIEQIMSLQAEGKPRIMQVPQHPGRAGKTIKPFFLWDKGLYMLGIGEDSERARQCFEGSKQKHLEILQDTTSSAAVAVKKFFVNWEQSLADNHPEIAQRRTELTKRTLVFYYDGKPVTEDEEIRRAWQEYLSKESGGKIGICMVTGKRGPIARLHPAIKGVGGTNPKLVSFNENAFNSYGMKQGYNASTSVEAAYAYGAALNYLLAEGNYVSLPRDITVVGWSCNGQEEPWDVLYAYLNSDNRVQNEDIWEALKKFASGISISWNQNEIDPYDSFCVLGLAEPNEARLPVRFFLKDEFGKWLRNIQAHEERIKIARPEWACKEALSYGRMIKELKTGDKDSLPLLSAELLQAILRNTHYPKELLSCTIRRIRADHDVNWRRMAMLKAYLLKNSTKINDKEEWELLNEETNNQAYLLGRLFSVLEEIQESSVDTKLNSTIKDHYFNSASSTPSLVFAQLMKLRESHMKKIRRDNPGRAVKLDERCMDIMDRLDMELPRQLNPEEQAVFMLGYYHQTQKRYQKKTEEE